MTDPPLLRKHRFVPSGRRSYGHRICATCDSLENASIHRVRDVTDEAREIDARKVGERESTQDTETR